MAGDRLDVLLGDDRAGGDALLQWYSANYLRGQAPFGCNPLEIPRQLRLIKRVGGNAWKQSTWLVITNRKGFDSELPMPESLR